MENHKFLQKNIKRYSKGLKFKIISSITSLLFLVIGGIIFLNTREGHGHMTTEMERNGKILAYNTLLAIRAPMSVGENETIAKMFAEMEKGQLNVDFYVTDTQKKITWSTESSLIGKNLSQYIQNEDLMAAVDKSITSGQTPNKGFYETVEGSPFYTQVRPILNSQSCSQCHEANKPVLGAFVSRESTAAMSHTLNRITWENIILGGLGFIIVVIILYRFIARQVIRPVKQMNSVLQDIAQGAGDLTARLEQKRTDEIGNLAGWFNTFVEKLQNVVQQVVDATRDFATITEKITTESHDLASRTTQQAAAIAKTSTTINDFSQNLTQSTNEALAVNKEIASFNREINTKSELIQNVTATMTSINDSSRKISHIVKVINDISFQTNLLALNAAVEAARAGEAGRGFAVVAAEVRILAQRTSEASQDIERIVNDNVDATTTGTNLVNQTSQFFSSLLGVMDGILKKIQEITRFNQEQSLGVQQVNDMVSQLEEVINHNAILSNELSENAKRMKNNSHQLTQLIAQFQV